MFKQLLAVISSLLLVLVGITVPQPLHPNTSTQYQLKPLPIVQPRCLQITHHSNIVTSTNMSREYTREVAQVSTVGFNLQPQLFDSFEYLFAWSKSDAQNAIQIAHGTI